MGPKNNTHNHHPNKPQSYALKSKTQKQNIITKPKTTSQNTMQAQNSLKTQIKKFKHTNYPKNNIQKNQSNTSQHLLTPKNSTKHQLKTTTNLINHKCLNHKPIQHNQNPPNHKITNNEATHPKNAIINNMAKKNPQRTQLTQN
jgi:hypothetical protein